MGRGICDSPLLILLVSSFLSAGLSSLSELDANKSVVPITGTLDLRTGHEAADAEVKEKLQEAQKELEGYLHWAIENSDPAKLKELAEKALSDAHADAKSQMQRGKIHELIQAMKDQPSEAGLMKEAIGVLTSPAASEDAKKDSLEALQYLVEPIDNANDLEGLGGLGPLVGLLGGAPGLQAGSAAVLGTAASNNVKFQEQLIDAFPSVLGKLLELTQSRNMEVASKGLYAVAALVRNSEGLVGEFVELKGLTLMQNLLRNENVTLAVRRKGLSLVADVALHGSQFIKVQHGPEVLSLFQAVQKLLKEEDWDVREKALLAIQALLDSNIGHARLFQRDIDHAMFEGLHSELVLESKKPGRENHEYIQDLLALCTSVQAKLVSAPLNDEL